MDDGRLGAHQEPVSVKSRPFLLTQRVISALKEAFFTGNRQARRSIIESNWPGR
jgi:hypothetical protein